MIKKYGFYLLAAALLLGADFLHTHNLVTGKPPLINSRTLGNLPANAFIEQGPAIIYIWAEWCGICRLMQNNISVISQDYPVLSIALQSGSDLEVQHYLQKNQLSWPAVVNDPTGGIAKQFGAAAVPAIFYLNKQGNIVFTSAGYSTVWGLRLRSWLAGLL